jgi:hypothetical protein
LATSTQSSPRKLNRWAITAASLVGCLALGPTLFISCGTETKSKEGQVRHIFVHGDPEELVGGTTMNSQSFLTESNLKNFDNFDFSIGLVISEFSEIDKDQSEKESSKSAEEMSATTENRSTLRAYSFRKYVAMSEGNSDKTSESIKTNETNKTATSQIYEYYDNKSRDVSLRGVVKPDGTLSIYEVLGQKVEVLHYSLSLDGRTFSILGRAQDAKTGKSLIHASFSQRYAGGSGPQLASPKFSFIAGKGVVYRWEKPTISLNLCILDGNRDRKIKGQGEAERTVVSLIQEAWGSWQRSGKIGDRPAQINIIDKNVPPFSDVNTACIYSIPKFAYESSNQFVTTGLTVPTTNSSLGTIETSTVFLFEQAIARAIQPRAYLGTAVHELGHFIGLGHEFERDSSGNYLNLSVMGYLNNGTLYPSEHDFLAVQEIYGAYPPVNQAR